MGPGRIKDRPYASPSERDTVTHAASLRKELFKEQTVRTTPRLYNLPTFIFTLPERNWPFGFADLIGGGSVEVNSTI